MAKLKPKQQNSTKKSAPQETFIIPDEKKLPIFGMFGRSPQISYPNEYAFLDAMKVGQSAMFPKDKLNVINAIRTSLSKTSNRKFMVRKVNPTHNRIWRVADNTITRTGGRQKGSPYRKADVDKQNDTDNK